MKKHHFIKMSSIALSLCVALGTFPATAFADDANATTITKAYVDKATYAPGEAATIYVDVDGATGTRTAHIQITHLNETVWENDVTFTANGGKTTVPISWTPPTTDHQGYLVSITIDGKQIVTAIDVSSDVTTYPRYGYSVDTQASKSIYLDGTKYMTAYFDATRNGVIPAEPDWYYYSYDASFTAPKNLYLTKGTHTLTIQQDADDKGGDIRLQTVTLGVYDENSVRLTNAAIAASGAMHIEMGSGMSTTANSGENFNDVSLLGNPYYPKAAKSMTSSLKQAMYNQYQFITAYENLLYDADVLPSDTGFQNISIQRMVVYCGNADDGYINFDCVRISKSA